MTQNIILQLNTLSSHASRLEAERFYDVLIKLLGNKRFNKTSAVIASVLKRNPQHVLDIGCGYGALSMYLALQGIRVTGIDIRQEELGDCNLSAVWRQQ